MAMPRQYPNHGIVNVIVIVIFTFFMLIIYAMVTIPESKSI